MNILAALQKTHWKIAGKGGAAVLLGRNPSSRIKKLGIVRGD